MKTPRQKKSFSDLVKEREERIETWEPIEGLNIDPIAFTGNGFYNGKSKDKRYN